MRSAGHQLKKEKISRGKKYQPEQLIKKLREDAAKCCGGDTFLLRADDRRVVLQRTWQEFDWRLLG